MESFGRYQLLDVVGRGDTGEVFRAQDTATGRAVAVKVLSAQLSEDPEFAQRFRDDTRLAASVNDPHIVPIHNYGDVDGRLYVDMRLIEGRDLATVVAHDGRLHPARAVAIIEQVGSALDTAHHAGLIHRDLQASNVLVDARDFAYLTFGTADNAAVPGPRADIPAMARLLYQCLTGQRLDPGAPTPQLSLTAPDIPPTLDAVIARGVAENPSERYQTATELAQAAQAALQLPPAAPAQPAPWHPAPLPPAAPPRRTGLVVGITAAVAVVVAIVAVAGYLVLRNVGSSGAQRVESGTQAVRVASSRLITESGSDEPKAVVSLYEDFLCPACGNFERVFGPTVSRLIDTSAVAADYYPVAILDGPATDHYSSRAGAAAYCVADESIGAFRRFHDTLFSPLGQPQEIGGVYPDNAQLIELAHQAGAGGGVADCINGEKYLARVTGMAKSSGIRGTPTVRINGEVYSFSTPDEMVGKIKEIVGNVPGL